MVTLCWVTVKYQVIAGILEVFASGYTLVHIGLSLRMMNQYEPTSYVLRVMRLSQTI